MKQPRQSLSVEEKMTLARQKAAEQNEKDRLKEEAYYLKISTGTQWTIFKVLSIYCVLLAGLITYETLVDGETKAIFPGAVHNQSGLIEIEGGFYTPVYTELAGFIDTSFRVVYSPLFGAAKYMVWTSKYQDTKTPLTLTDYDAWRRNSVYEYFIFIQVILLIPFCVMLYKRPSGLFKFGRMTSLILIFPASIYLLFVTIGLADLLPL
jgi:hypothetical protein